ncbi:MAG: serine/threonine-protein kinase [Eubacterium sp.]|nr:serine/threonine-protein kinase [Eubacterium sp.]
MLREGTVLDEKYEILRRIGEGGMSIVYLARNNRMNMQLAVKEIKNDGSKSAEVLLKGLEREANILKDVDHPVIPRIIDIVKHSGTICVVMDFIEGENLADKLKEVERFSQDKVIEWGLELASALEYLHSMNPPIIYRDMKPSNVMLKPDGGVKLIDFGTAKTYDIENNADTTALGTRGYAAPEQFGDAQGRGIYKTDARTDIYNLGATLYHMVTGKNPQEPPYEMVPIREVDPMLSTGLEQIILKCTKPNPNERYQSCSELIYALEHYTELDDDYKQEHKKKVTMFGTTIALAIVFAIVAIVGKSGMNKINAENYTAYIESGNEMKTLSNYSGAANKYKEAFELNGEDAEAYTKYIDTYIDAKNDIDNPDELVLEDGLSVVANRIKNGYGEVDKNNEVLYKMGLTYFNEVGDYAVAAKYFGMVESKDEDYGELADYYGSIALILSSTNVNVNELIDKVNGFASYNSTALTNDNRQKFENYRTVGKIYVTYLNSEGVAAQAETTMNQALKDLEGYTGDDTAEFFYSYNNDLAEIYYALASTDGSETNYKLALNYYQEVIDQIQGKVTVSETNASDSVQSYIQAYINNMCRMADIYGKLGDSDSALETYEKAESELGEGNTNAVKVYSEHLNYLYTTYESAQQDPGKWTAAQKEKILKVYNEGNKLDGIGSNPNWIKRSSVMEGLGDGSIEEEEKEEEKTDEETTEEDTEEEGE